MNRAFIFVVLAGLLIGLAWPSGERAAPPSASSAGAGRQETVLEREGNGHFYTHARLNDDELVNFLVDTGASVVVLTIDDAERLGLAVNPAAFAVVGEGAGGPVRGQEVMLDSVDVDGKRVENVRAVVLEGSKLSLLGQSYLSRMGEVQMSGEYMVLK